VEDPKPAAAATPVAPPVPPAPAPAAPQAKALVSEAVVLFRFNSTRLTPAARTLLDDWAANAPKGAKVYVTGHADRIGSARYNKKLSLRRAKAVRAYLVSKGMKAQSIQVAAKGYAAPVKSCDGKVSRAIIVCLAPNRRVEVKP
jgi:OOP family OmpA-OmpF porin